MTVRQLDQNMTKTELRKWAAFSQLWPFGQQVEDARFASIAQVQRMMGATTKGKAERLGKFLVVKRYQKEEDVQELGQKLVSVFSGFGMVRKKRGEN